MEEKKEVKNNNKTVIIILLVIIFLLVGTFVTLILTGVINFNKNTSNQVNTNVVDDTNNTNDNNIKDEDVYVTITGDGVRVRDKASTKDSKVLGSASKGTKFKLIDYNIGSSGNGCAKDWYKIDYKGNEGYICSEFATINSSDDRCKIISSVKYIKDIDAEKIVGGFFTPTKIDGQSTSQSIVQFIDWGREYSFCEFNYDEEVDGKDIGLMGKNAENWYAVCGKYKSYNELETYLNKYVTYNYMKNYLFISNTKIDEDGEFYYYKEYKNKLYGLTPHKGGYSLKENNSKNKYNIITHSNDRIEAVVNRYYSIKVDANDWEDSIDEKYIVLKLENGSWKIDDFDWVCK